MTTAPFPVDPVLTAITLSYRNRRLIADDVLPRIDPPFDKSLFNYHKFTIEDSFSIPDTKVGRSSAPNEVEFTAERVQAETQDFGLEDPIPQDDINQAPPGMNPQGHATQTLTDLIMLDRELRVANIVFNAATYPTGQKEVLAGANQWNDPTSDPIGKINDSLDVPLIRPNIGVIGRLAFSKLSTHPDIVSAVQANSGTKGIAQRQAIANLFELDEILVGEGFLNSAKKGQAPVFARVWGKDMALIWIDRLARGDNDRIAFGFTAQYGNRVAGQMPDPKIGLRGGVRVRVGEGVKEVTEATETGYFLENVAA